MTYHYAAESDVASMILVFAYDKIVDIRVLVRNFAHSMRCCIDLYSRWLFSAHFIFIYY